MNHLLTPSAARLYAAALGLGLAACCGLATPAAAAEPKVGDMAPAFTMMGSDGKPYTLAEFKGKKPVVLAWFPKAFTGGCTVQCTSLAEKGKAIQAMNVALFTASVDAPEENKRFGESLHAGYPILSDPDKSVAKSYGVLSEKGYSNRWTFFIDKDGVIREIDKNIKTKQAAEDVMAKVKSLGLAAE